MKFLQANKLFMMATLSFVGALIALISVSVAWFTISNESKSDEFAATTTDSAVNISLYRFVDDDKKGYAPSANDYDANGSLFQKDSRTVGENTIETYSFTYNDLTYYYDRVEYGSLMNSNQNNGKVIPGDVVSFLLVIDNENTVNTTFSVNFMDVSSSNYGTNEKIQNAFKFQINRIFEGANLGLTAQTTINISQTGRATIVNRTDYFDSEDSNVNFISNYYYNAVPHTRIMVFFDIIFDGNYQYSVDGVSTNNSNVFANQILTIGKIHLVVG